MKRLLTIALGAVLALAMPGCALIADNIPGTAGQVIAAPVGDMTLRDEQGYWAVATAYNVPAQAYVSADKRGLIPPNLKAVLKPKLITMYDLLKAARTAYKFGDAAGFAAKRAALEKLRDEIMPLIPR